MHENREASSLTEKQERISLAGEGDSRTTGTNGDEESDFVVVPMRQPNKTERSAAEVVEGRTETKENIQQTHTSPTQSGYSVSQGLPGVR